MHRLRNAADLLDNGIYRRPSPWVIALVIQHHPYRSLADLRRAPVRRLAHIGSTFSGVGASDEPRAVQQVWAIRFWLDQHRRLRDRALFDLAIDSKLRGCDVVRIRIGDVVSGGRIRDRAIIVQQKTKRPVQFELMETARKTLRSWLERRGGTLNDFVFPSRNDYMAHMSTRQYARLVHEWVVGIGLAPQEYGTHSLRRTKASIIYKATGNLRAVQILLGHAKIDSTVRYLGVDVEDALELAERTEV